MAENRRTAKEIAAQIIEGRTSGEIVESRLSTSERILARVTDGIYRQPSSALRELVANAYDADATHVHILTDAPRFDKIIVRDDGLGLSPDVLAYVIQSIGGSAKRTYDGVKLGITAEKDSKHSPAGRGLIGKIGIGLFSVAQLTSHFQIITKVRGERYRTFADIILHTHSEDHMEQDVERKEFETGSVKIWSVPTEDVDEQGTEIVLINIRNSAKEVLQSRERWLAFNSEQDDTDPSHIVVEPPIFHIGSNININGSQIIVPSQLPWDGNDSPKEKFNKLVEAMANELGGRTNPRLEGVFDNYLSTIWTLSLAAPLNYIDGHPFSHSEAEDAVIYQISNVPKGHPKALTLARGKTVRETLGLSVGMETSPLSFDVYVDGIQLSRPIKYRDLPETRNAFKKPLLMVGASNPDLSAIPEEYRGGNLSFEAYLFWGPKIIPRDHVGVMVRIHEASGTLFDETFMKYQVSEQTRLRQITAEIFVKEGLDSALNIDRESFNYSHPHYQYIKKWLHSALRQLASTHKRLAKEVRDREREGRAEAHKTEIQKTVEEVWIQTKGEDESPPEILFMKKGETGHLENASSIVFDREDVFPERNTARQGAVALVVEERFEEQIKALTSVLVAYGLFADMSKEKQQELLRAIARIFTVESN